MPVVMISSTISTREDELALCALHTHQNVGDPNYLSQIEKGFLWPIEKSVSPFFPTT